MLHFFTQRSFAFAELYLTIATIFSRFDFQLYDTGIENIQLGSDGYMPIMKSPGGVRVTAKKINHPWTGCGHLRTNTCEAISYLSYITDHRRDFWQASNLYPFIHLPRESILPKKRTMMPSLNLLIQIILSLFTIPSIYKRTSPKCMRATFA